VVHHKTFLPGNDDPGKRGTTAGGTAPDF